MNHPEQNSNKQPTSSKTNGAVAGEGGFLFEMNMAAVIGLRGMQTDDFKLSSNIEHVGNFDDLLCTASGRRYYLQLKHSEISDKNLEKRELKELLQKCFESYCKIKRGEALENIQIDNRKFVIYTNRKLDPKLSWCKKKYTGDDIFFKTCDNGIFTFIRDNTGGRNDVHTLLENPVKKGKNDKDSKDPGLKPPVDMVNEFLNQLIMVTGQKGNQELDALVAEEIKNKDAIKLDDKECISILYHFKTPLGTWWRSSNRGVLTLQDLTNWLQRAKTEHFTPFVTGLINICTTKFVGTRIKFSESSVSWLQAELSDKRAVHLRSDALTLCSKLLQDCLNTSKCIFVTFESLQNNKDMLLYAWLGGNWERLIVFCDSTVQKSDISDICNKITEIMQCYRSSKSIVILTACSVKEIKGFVPKPYNFEFEQLSEESQEIVLDKMIDFQGCEVTLRSVLQRHGNVQHVLGPELVTDMITEGTPINIGGRLQANTENYVHRNLYMNIYLKLGVLKNPASYPDIFVVSGMTKEELLNIVPLGECVEKEFKDEARYIVKSMEDMKNYFSQHCETYSGETLHWLRYKDGKLLWKKTRGKLHNVLNFMDADTCAEQRIARACMKSGSCEIYEKEIWNLGERTVLVVAEPGMGKSSTTTQVAWHTKLAYSTWWVVHINWNDHTGKLQEINAATFNIDSLFEFLCSVAFPESKYTDINRILLKQALQNSGNVTVLMDGFDEISPTYAVKAAAVLRELKKTAVGRVWVTSSPLQRERLEKELSVISFSMKKLSCASQKQLLRSIWKNRANGEKEKCLDQYVKDLLSHTNKSVDQRNFTGCPLYIVMIASAFEENLEKSLETAKISLPGKLDLLDVYDRFIKRKLHIYETEKKRVDLTNPSHRDDHEGWIEMYMENLEKYSLLVTLSSELNPLSDAEMHTTIQPFVERIQDGKDRIGIVMNVTEDRPQFVNRSFAEYLTARWFSRNFESNRKVLEIILFDCSYGIVKDVFDRILARRCPLHCAVLDWNADAVETLLKGGSDVNDVDSGGRTAMHLIAAQGAGDSVCEEITSSLLGNGASVDTKDKVLQCTPLGYAIRAENWLVVEWLLEQRCNTTDLELIGQKVDDESYIGRIMDIMQYNDYPLLFQHIANICANTRWAPLVDAVVARI